MELKAITIVRINEKTWLPLEEITKIYELKSDKTTYSLLDKSGIETTFFARKKLYDKEQVISYMNDKLNKSFEWKK